MTIIVKPTTIEVGSFRFAPGQVAAILIGEDIGIHYVQSPSLYALKPCPWFEFQYEGGAQIGRDLNSTVTELNNIFTGLRKDAVKTVHYQIAELPQTAHTSSLVNIAGLLEKFPWVKFSYAFVGTEKTYNGSFVVSKKGISDHLEFDDFSTQDLFEFIFSSGSLIFTPPEDGVLGYAVIGEIQMS